MQTDLTALIERVESGSGSDRELHADVLEAFGRCVHRRTHKEECDNDGYDLVCSDCGSSDLWLGMNPTSSLDAVLSLIEAKLPEAVWNLPSAGTAWVIPAGSGNDQHFGDAASPARALLAAALRALQDGR